MRDWETHWGLTTACKKRKETERKEEKVREKGGRGANGITTVLLKQNGKKH